MSAPRKPPLRSIEDCERRNVQAGGYWFSPSTLRFFGSRFGRNVYPCPDGSLVFTESQQPPNGARIYRVCRCLPSGDVVTFPDTGDVFADSVTTSRAARKIAETWARQIREGKAEPDEAEPDEDEPGEGDYVRSPSGPLGGLTTVSVQGERCLGEFRTEDEANLAIREDQRGSGVYPSVWDMSDHGNLSRDEGWSWDEGGKA